MGLNCQLFADLDHRCPCNLYQIALLVLAVLCLLRHEGLWWPSMVKLSTSTPSVGRS